jgi:hypothetical protein
MSEPAGVNEERRKLRVEVVLEDAVAPRWIASMIDRLASAGFVELAGVVVASKPQQAPNRRAALAFSVYDRLDRRIFRSKTDALEPTDLSNIISIHGSERDDPDVVINLASSAASASSSRPRLGEWTVHHGGSRWHSDPPFFWETYRREPVVVTLVCAQRPEDDARVIYRTVSATDAHSPARGLNAACWKVSGIVLERLAQLHQHGWSFFESLATYHDRDGLAASVSEGAPGNLQLIGYLGRLGPRLLVSRLRKQLEREEWFLAYRRGSWPDEPGDMARFRRVPRVAGRYFADPFVFGRDGRHYVFFEDYRVREGRGVISYVEIREDGGVSKPRVVLERPYHLSYPFVFVHDGAVLMVPESSANRTIELYRAEAFPESWVLDRVLMNDVQAVDATLVEHRDRWWLFASMREHGTHYSDELFLFSAASLDAEWSPHPLNPIVSDVRRARPAGRIFLHDGALIRPGQDSSGSYGAAVVFSRIERLSETEFRETPISRLGPDWMRSNLGTHTYNFDDAYEVVDGRRRRSKFRR